MPNNYLDRADIRAYFNLHPEDEPSEDERRAVEQWVAEQHPMIEDLPEDDGEDSDVIHEVTDDIKNQVNEGTQQEYVPTEEEIAEFHQDMASENNPFDLPKIPNQIEGDE